MQQHTRRAIRLRLAYVGRLERALALWLLEVLVGACMCRVNYCCQPGTVQCLAGVTDANDQGRPTDASWPRVRSACPGQTRIAHQLYRTRAHDGSWRMSTTKIEGEETLHRHLRAH